jgi:hypothetical protein
MTWTWRVSPVRAADGMTPAVSGKARRRGAGVRLWVLLHAPALLAGRSGSPADVALIEDDRRRLAARRAR